MAIIHPLNQIPDRNVVPAIPQVVFYGHDPKVNGKIFLLIIIFCNINLCFSCTENYFVHISGVFRF